MSGNAMTTVLGGPTVLFVGRGPIVGAGARRALRTRLGAGSLETGDPASALALARSVPRLDLLVVPGRLPGGLADFGGRVRELWPGLPVLVWTLLPPGRDELDRIGPPVAFWSTLAPPSLFVGAIRRLTGLGEGELLGARRPGVLPALSAERAARLEGFLDEVAALTSVAIERLELADATDRDRVMMAWDLLRDATRGEPEHGWRRQAMECAWAAVTARAGALGLGDLPPRDGYWRVALGPLNAAARQASLAAAALVAPSGFDHELRALLLGPWRATRDEPEDAPLG